MMRCQWDDGQPPPPLPPPDGQPPEPPPFEELPLLDINFFITIIPDRSKAILETIKAFPAKIYNIPIAIGIMLIIFVATPIINMPIIFFILARPAKKVLLPRILTLTLCKCISYCLTILTN
uniref:Uncharacterized protein n=1 Tax=Glossina brevipalpis TaxID=37001 RepID=A0A1A9W5N5_9MUSC